MSKVPKIPRGLVQQIAVIHTQQEGWEQAVADLPFVVERYREQVDNQAQYYLNKESLNTIEALQHSLNEAQDYAEQLIESQDWDQQETQEIFVQFCFQIFTLQTGVEHLYREKQQQNFSTNPQLDRLLSITIAFLNQQANKNILFDAAQDLEYFVTYWKETITPQNHNEEEHQALNQVLDQVTQSLTELHQWYTQEQGDIHQILTDLKSSAPVLEALQEKFEEGNQIFESKLLSKHIIPPLSALIDMSQEEKLAFFEQELPLMIQYMQTVLFEYSPYVEDPSQSHQIIFELFDNILIALDPAQEEPVTEEQIMPSLKELDQAFHLLDALIIHEDDIPFENQNDIVPLLFRAFEGYLPPVIALPLSQQLANSNEVSLSKVEQEYLNSLEQYAETYDLTPVYQSLIHAYTPREHTTITSIEGLEG